MATASNRPPTDELKNSVPAKSVPAKEAPGINAANGSVRVEIFDQVYNLRGSDAAYILKLAEYVDSKMRAVSQQTATVDSVRLAVLAALKERRPDVKVVLMSGFGESEALRVIGTNRFLAFLQKPFNAGELPGVIASVLHPQ